MFVLLLLAALNLTTAQPLTVKEKIAESIAQYFELDRETIHAHFDKSVFFTNEQVWFKGYCFNKKQGTPFFETTNVFAVLHDESGKQISEQLLFSYIGVFSGNFKLGAQLKSGRYYIRFYTNWMNNFPEDESATYAINVINENETAVTEFDAPDYSKINIAFHPEGGHFVQGVSNVLGVKISDCDGMPIEVHDAAIVDEKGETLTSFSIGRNGCGKTLITPGSESLKLSFALGEKRIVEPLPKAGEGVAIEVNNYALPGKTIVKLKSDGKTLAKYANKTLHLVVQQNNKSTIFDTKLSSQGTELVFGNDNLYTGVNTIRIIDENLDELASRMICEIPNETKFFTFSKTTGETVKIVGHSNYPNADISISVLPSDTKSMAKPDIHSDFMVNPYLMENTAQGVYYFDNPTKGKRYELDMLLLNQAKNKYEWRNIKTTPAKPNYSFDIGLAVKGTINQTLPDPKKFRMLLSSGLSMINDYSAIDEKNGFYFPNLIFGNVSNFKFTLLKIPSDPVNATFIHQVQNRRRPYNKPFTTWPAPCSTGRLVPLDVPQFGNNVIALANIDIVGRAKSELKYGNKFGNASLRGYKIDDSYKATTLLQFINANGFNVIRNMGNITITGRLQNTVNGQQSTPEIYINARRLTSFDELDQINMDEVDEIYLNAHAIVASMNNNMGVIKIYMKKLGYDNARSATKSFEIKEGFSPIDRFEQPVYLSTADAGFEKYGIVYWIPTVLTNSEGDFVFEFPKTDAKTVKLQIQGFTPEGKLVNHVETITLN